MRVIVRDTFADFPDESSSLGGLHSGDIAITLDTDELYFWNGSAWTIVSAQQRQVTLVSTTPYTVLPTDEIIFVDATGGDMIVNLPPAAERTRAFGIKKTVGSPSNQVTLTPQGGDLIEGVSTKDLTAAGDSVRLQSDGVSNWWIV